MPNASTGSVPTFNHAVVNVTSTPCQPSSPPIAIAGDMESLFRKWMSTQTSQRGGAYTQQTIDDYCTALSDWLEDAVFSALPVHTVFVFIESSKYSSYKAQVESQAGYPSFNNAAIHGPQRLHAAMELYGKFLDDKQIQASIKCMKAMSPYLAAIRTKPFILLAGISGTGKSRLVRQLARGCCPSGHELGKDNAGNADKAKKPGNFEMIPVRPNWHDSTELMGYVTRLTDGNKPKYVIKPFVKFLVKAAIYKDVPFFLCLDEMNLAPVEQYFAEYLSVVETRKKENGEIVSDVLVNFDLPEIDVKETVKELMRDWIDVAVADGAETVTEKVPGAKAVYDKIIDDKGIRIPKNFVVMGTVNMDETTCSFSRKVLDRAMTFELNEVDMEEGLASDNSVPYGSISAQSAFAADVEGVDFYAANKDKCDAVKAYLVAVNKLLDGTPFKFAYRSRNEIMLYCIERTKSGIVELPQALDEATSMKILSRIEGDEQKLQVPKRDGAGNIIKGAEGRAEMMSLLDKDALPKVIADALKAANNGVDPNPPCTVCSEKLAFMAGRLESGFTNFFV